MSDVNLDREMDRLVEGLPQELRGDWCVVPRRLLLQVFIVGLLFGGSAALVAVAHAYDLKSLRWVWPIVVAALLLATRLVPWWRGDRFEDQLRASRSNHAQPPA